MSNLATTCDPLTRPTTQNFENKKILLNGQRETPLFFNTKRYFKFWKTKQVHTLKNMSHENHFQVQIKTIENIFGFIHIGLSTQT